MSIYVDSLRDYGWYLGPSCHLVADTEEELHRFAKKIGMQRRWFQPHASLPHYDLTVRRRAVAVARGAKEISDQELAAMIARRRTTPTTGGTDGNQKPDAARAVQSARAR